MSASFLVLLAVVAAVVGLCFLGIGVGILLGRKKRLGTCSCDFDADKARAAAARPAGGCCGGAQGGCGCKGDRTA